MQPSESENNANKNFLLMYSPFIYVDALIIILDFFYINEIKLI